jgi:hypothetical protein
MARLNQKGTPMIRSLKAAFGLSLLTALAMSVFGVFNASAIQSGHFTSEFTKTSYIITEGTDTDHKTQLTAFGGTVTCHNVKYVGHHTGAATFTSLTVTPTYSSCTHNASNVVAHVRMNGCHYQFTSRVPPAHATAHFICPSGVKAEVEVTTSPISTMKFGTQTPTAGGVVYETIEMEKKHAITANITVEGIHGTCHGPCQIFGTETKTGKLTGSVTVQGKNTDTGVLGHLTAT